MVVVRKLLIKYKIDSITSIHSTIKNGNLQGSFRVSAML